MTEARTRPADGVSPRLAARVDQRRRREVPQLIDTLRRFDRRGPRRLVWVSACAFVAGASEAAVLAFVTSAAVSTTDAQTGGIGFLALDRSDALLAAAGSLVLNLISAVLLSRSSSRMAADAGLAARQQLLEAYHRASFAQKTTERVAVLQERLTTHVDRFLTSFGALALLLSSCLSLLAFAITAVLIDATALVALAVLGALVLAIQRPVATRTRTASSALLDKRTQYASAVTESVLLAREMTVFGVADRAGRQMLDVDRDVARNFARTRFLTMINTRLYQVLAFALVIAGLALVGGRSTEELAGIAAVALILLRSLTYGQAVLGNLQTISEQRPFVDDLTRLIDHLAHAAPERGHSQADRLERIQLERVTFRYADRVALDGVDLGVDAAETIGVIGPSGAGKTTLVNLLLRLYAPSDGRITLNGVDLIDVIDADWHRLTAIVPQEPRLLHGTIADNIRFFRDIDDAGIERAADAAHIGDFIRSRPEGFDAQVGELGQNLSGGQRQRICIARALAGDPQLLVLDEPTSALDGESEAAIQATLTELKGSVAMILVAHRLSTLSICDRIVVVDRGRIVDSGSTAELRRTSSYFRDAMAQAGM